MRLPSESPRRSSGSWAAICCLRPTSSTFFVSGSFDASAMATRVFSAISCNSRGSAPLASVWPRRNASLTLCALRRSATVMPGAFSSIGGAWSNLDALPWLNAVRSSLRVARSSSSRSESSRYSVGSLLRSSVGIWNWLRCSLKAPDGDVAWGEPGPDLLLALPPRREARVTTWSSRRSLRRSCSLLSTSERSLAPASTVSSWIAFDAVSTRRCSAASRASRRACATAGEMPASSAGGSPGTEGALASSSLMAFSRWSRRCCSSLSSMSLALCSSAGARASARARRALASFCEMKWARLPARASRSPLGSVASSAMEAGISTLARESRTPRKRSYRKRSRFCARARRSFGGRDLLSSSSAGRSASTPLRSARRASCHCLRSPA
mmetsp:Transcript_48291/g.148983  ORF Transcript_48291/g.148983 Transcript_48291/m.148983 type:complete len:383 (-) Transcript_48291:992-2140(-)